MRNANAVDILLIEDHPGDARLTQEAFRSTGRRVRLYHAWDGVEAMSFLRQDGIHIDAPRPSVILLDLSMPRMCGRETLSLIKRDADLRAIPVLVLTTSEDEADVLACYRMGANCFLRKPTKWDEFEGLIRAINNFWFSKAQLPQPITADAA
jgi:chemotaxis family two-component system response regulator Rcp1